MNKKFILIVFAIIIALSIAVLALDIRLKTVYYTVENEKSDEKMRIALITDLHSCSYGGKDMSVLLDAVYIENPDVVLFGGDIIDDELPEENAVTVMTALAKKYPCYYVSGNHEEYTERLDEIKETVRSCGVKVLDGIHTKMAISAVSGTPDIYGFDDTLVYEDFEEQNAHIGEVVDNYHFKESYNILLIHRPEFIESYAEHGFDLVLCGHAHGGLWRIPGVLNGLYAPGEGLFPKYAGGFYEVGETKMIVSRGLGKESTRIPRIFNRPELVIIDIT